MCMGCALRAMARRWGPGLQVGLGQAGAALALAVTFGAFAVGSGLPPWAAVLMSAVTFSGTAQFAFLSSVTAGGGVAAAVGAGALVNSRFLPMAAASSSALRGSATRQALEAQLVVDGSWAAAQRADGTVDRDVLLPASVVQWPAWIAGTAIGAYARPPDDVVQALGLDVVFPAFFVILLLRAVRLRTDMRLPMLASAGAALAALWVLPAGTALLVGCVPALVAGARRRG